ncbi:MAG: nicotinate phosphoribosyltransferase [Erysipelotrichaceae bacterium]|jgi:nicotinate phosphoribosyltransferase|nr:nicotinate phosphoribosyltransferase [Erysipelotrichaceae bacterium]
MKRFDLTRFYFDPKADIKKYAANYFLKSQAIVAKHLPGNIVTMQFFQRANNAMLCGIDEVLSLIKTYAIKPLELEIYALHDGDIIKNQEPVLLIKGKYENFGFLESIIDGILSRRTAVATNTRRILRAAAPIPVFSMADRQDDPLTQRGDGYASYVAGIRKFSTDEQGALMGIKGMGTMPHALIQVCGGDVIKAAKLYHETYPKEAVTALVDYHNDVINDTLSLARALKGHLGAVRIDTSISLIDAYFERINEVKPENYGVSPKLIKALRSVLDEAGFLEVKIIVSSGFSPTKIRQFKKLGVPVDLYGVGSYIIKNSTSSFTGDLVMLNGRNEAKVGRKLMPNKRLVRVNLND